MKHRWLARAAGVVCAICVAVGVMSTSVFAGDEVPQDEAVYLAELPEPTFVIVDDLPAGVDEPLDVTDNRVEVPMYLGDELIGVCPIVNGDPWVSVTGVCEALGLPVQTAERDGVLTVTADGLELTARVGDIYFACNGRYLYVPDGVQAVDGAVILPVDELVVDCFGLAASWDRPRWQVTVLPEEPVFLASGDEYYNETDVYWLSRLIGAEAGGQPLEAQVAVGSVCVNRLSDPAFAGQSNIYDVIFAKNQFEAVANGTIYTAPGDMAVLAAKLALEDCDAADGATYVAVSDLGADYECVAQLGDLWFFA